MRTLLGVVLVLVVVAGSGCRTPASKLADDDPPSGLPRIGITGGAIYLPAVKLEADRDDVIETSPGARFRSDPESNDGYGLHIAYGHPWFTTGILFLESRHRDKDARSRLDVYQAYGEFLVGPRLGIPEVKGVIQGGVGIGGVRFNYERRTFNDGGALAAEARAQGGVEIYGHAHVLATGGVFVWGYPGETLGQGGFVGVEFGFDF